MSLRLQFEMDGLTEEEKYKVEKRVELIRDMVYPPLNIDSTGLHRENRVFIDQDIIDHTAALELFKLLSNVGVDKKYDDYYETGEDSRLRCSLSCVRDFPL